MSLTSQTKPNNMKAIVCEQHGLPNTLVLRDLPNLEPGPNEVIVNVKACSINFPDTLIIQGKYQFQPDLPFTPGSDISGVVKSVGSAVKNHKVGDEVFGIVQYGGFAEELCVKASHVFPKMSGMDFPTAASFIYAYGTSYHALKQRAQLQAGETLVILGASGGVGLAALELGKAMGARVIAAASTSEKLALCKERGADEVINYTEEDLKSRIKALTDGKGADVIYDPVGGDYSEAALRATKWNGRYLVIGFAAGEIPRIPLNLALLKGCSIVGVFWGRFTKEEPQNHMQNTMELMQMYGEGKIKPHIHKIYPLAETPKALEDMMNRKVRGKVVISI